MMSGKRIGIMVGCIIVVSAIAVSSIAYIWMNMPVWRGTFTITKPGNLNYERFKDIFVKILKNNSESVVSDVKKHPEAEQKIIDEHKSTITEILVAINYKKIFDGWDDDMTPPLIKRLVHLKELNDFDINSSLDSKLVDKNISLILAEKLISNEFVLTLEDVQNLQTIDLSGLMLNSVPTAFKIFKNLKEIRLPGAGIRSDVENLRLIETLEVIDVKNNELTAIPALKEFKRLVKIDLSGNKIEKIDAAALDEDYKAVGDRIIMIYLVPRDGKKITLPSEKFIQEHPKFQLITSLPAAS